MTLSDYLSTLRRQWWVVLLVAARGTGAAAAWTATRTPVYQAHSTLFVSVSTGRASAADLSSGSSFVQQRVKSYADVITGDPVMTDVISRLGLDLTPAELARKVTAQSPLDTVLLELTVTDTDATRAAAIANAVADRFPAYVAELETPGGADSTGTLAATRESPVTVRPTRPATVPQAPSSPRVPLNLGLGLLVGLGLGVGIAVLRNQLNTSVSTAADVEAVTGASPLAMVPRDKRAARQPIVDVGESAGRAEAYRTLRTNLQFANVDEPPRVVVVTSALADEGKSSTACNLALTLAHAGATVALLDGDLRRPSVCAYMGGLSTAAGLTGVLAEKHQLRDVLVQHGETQLAIVPPGPPPPNPSELLGSAQMAKVVRSLANHFDCVVIDAPPLLPVTDAAVLATLADGVLLVARHGTTSRESLRRAVQTLNGVNATLLGTVLNAVPAGRLGDYYGYGYGTAVVEVPKQRTELDLSEEAPAARVP